MTVDPIRDDASVPAARRGGAKRAIVALVKLAIVIVLVFAIQRTLSAAWNELRSQSLEIHFGWLLAASVFYIVGLLPAAWYWYWLLRAWDQPVDWLPTFRAHYIGHLGKYVPGKAMVIILRVGLLPAAQRAIGPASLAVFYETLMLMTVGAIVSAGILMSYSSASGVAATFAIVAATGSLVVTLPPVLRQLGGVIAYLKPNWSLGGELRRVGWLHYLVGWLANFAVWLLFGLSFWATLRALAPAASVPLADYPYYLASVALSIVAGFASMIPGGALVRESVLLELLETRVGPGIALAAAVLLRVVWLLSELAISAILYAVGLRWGDARNAPLAGE